MCASEFPAQGARNLGELHTISHYLLVTSSNGGGAGSSSQREPSGDSSEYRPWEDGPPSMDMVNADGGPFLGSNGGKTRGKGQRQA